MSVEKKWEHVLNRRFQMGHASWPVFGSPLRIGDVGRLDGALFHRLQSAESMGLDLSHAGHRVGPGSSLELSYGVKKSGSLSASGQESGGTASMDLAFESHSSFWFYAPEFTVEEVDAPEVLGRDVAQLLEKSGRGLAGAERIVYRLVRVSQGTFLSCQSNSASATVALTAGPKGAGKLEVRSQSESLIKSELLAASGPAVIAFDLVRVGAKRVRVGV